MPTPALPAPGILVTLAGFVLLLGPLVFIHELGHYLVGRWFGVKAETFAIGFGKELMGWTDRRGTRWKVCLLPLGGYVQFAGDANPVSQPSAEWLALPAEERAKTLPGRPLYQRALVVAAGPITNFLFAILILAGFNYAYGKVVAAPVIGTVEAGSVAQQAGLRPGDRVVSIRGEVPREWEAMHMAIAQHPGEPLDMVVERGGQRIALPVVARDKRTKDKFGNEMRIGYLGIAPARAELKPVGPVEAVTLAVQQTGRIVSMSVTGIGQIVAGKREVKELGGPIKIAKFSGEALSMGWLNFVWFVALISINLGFINLLPIPVLDGGHLALYGIEAVRRRPVSERGQEWAFRTGLAFVVGLMLFVTVNDLASLRLFGG